MLSHSSGGWLRLFQSGLGLHQTMADEEEAVVRVTAEQLGVQLG